MLVTPRKYHHSINIGLLDLIVKSGIADAIEGKLSDLKGNQGAVAETIENNVRSKIIKEHLNDPAFFDKMSALLDEVINQRKAKAIEYAEYLKQIAEVVKKVTQGQSANQPADLDTPGKVALFNNLRPQAPTEGVMETEARYITSNDNEDLDLVMQIDAAIHTSKKDGWRGKAAKENIIKGAMYEVLDDFDEVIRLFDIIKLHNEY